MSLVVRILCVVLVVAGIGCAGEPRSGGPHDLHFQAIVVDTHGDITQRLLARGFDLATRHPDGSVDIPRARDGGVDALFFSIYVPGSVTGQTAVDRTQSQVAAVQRQVEKHTGDLGPATTA